jgi:hypothetical protein|tara:strand:- start:250 stop:552 length:303 start_codon:yes stop_codon:yes gene_type:complete
MNPIDKKNKEIVELNKIETNWDYRHYLMNNAKSIMSHNKYNSCLNTGIINDITNGTKGSNPYLFNSTLDRARPFGYQTSDMKETFIYKRHGEMTKIAPKI